VMANPEGLDTIQLRRATADDCHTFWVMANDSTVRQNSFSTDPIPWDVHQAWFKKTLADPECVLLVVMRGQQVAGQVRFNIDGSHSVISISVVKEMRGRGLGSRVIQCASQYIFDALPVQRIHAYIKPENQTSITSFQKAGYIYSQMKTIQNCPAMDFVFSREPAPHDSHA
jgi:UDP-2,4-diacetamido-2,4,6-trideoxy-beta-L-altropyranose hydrolase